MSPIRVLLVDDHTLVRSGVRALLQSMENLVVVGEASDGREALRMVGIHQPDLVLMDIAMRDLNGLEATRRIAKQYPNVRVIILSMHANEEYVWQALRAGASGYLVKDAGIAELELAVTAVARGEIYLSPPISKHVVMDYVRRVSREAEQRTLSERTSLERLTQRQREILQLIAEGLTTQEIAQKLNIHVKTVETHRTQLMERLDIHDVAGLVRYAIRTGLISADE